MLTSISYFGSATVAVSAAAPQKAATPAEVSAFVASMNADYKARYIEPNAAEWVAETYITDDTQMLTARANERWLQWLSAEIDASRAYENVAGTDARDARALALLKLQTAMPAPKDPAHLTELTTLASKLTAAYGAGSITANYDGAHKHRTVIEADVHVGSNCVLVAPVTIGAGGTIGGGSTITKNTEPGALTVARGRAVSFANWQRPKKAPK